MTVLLQPSPLRHPRWSPFLPGHNGVTTPSFEGGVTTGWAFDLGGTAVARAGAPHGGFVCEVAVATALNNFSSGASTAPSATAAAAGEVWDGMLWTEDGTGSGGQDLYIRFRNGGASLALFQMGATGRKRNGWSQHAVSPQTAPANTTNVIVELYNQSTVSVLRIDAAQLRRH